jgi:acyl carrier protein
VTVTDRNAVRDAVIVGLAEVHGVSPADVEEVIDGTGGDDLLELDSKTAEWIIVHAEKEFGATLPTPVEMGREQFATVVALVAAIADALGIAE